MAITLSLAVCRIIYNLHFGVDMPRDLSYQSAANKVFARVGRVEFDKLVVQAQAKQDAYVRGILTMARDRNDS